MSLHQSTMTATLSCGKKLTQQKNHRRKASWQFGKLAGVDNIPSELVQAGGEAMTDMLLVICNKIWQTGEWPTPWTQSLIITLPKKGNLQLCQNYRTISLISHLSNVMLTILLLHGHQEGVRQSLACSFVVNYKVV